MMTNDEIMAELRSDSRLNRARAKFSGWAARMEQERRFSAGPSAPLKARGLEFEAVKDIIKAWEEQ